MANRTTAEGKKIKTTYHVTRLGLRLTVKRGRKTVIGPDWKPKTFRTRDSAVRLARKLTGQ
jgi:hypothetical protein